MPGAERRRGNFRSRFCETRPRTRNLVYIARIQRRVSILLNPKITSSRVRARSEFFLLARQAAQTRWPAFSTMQVPDGYWPEEILFLRLSAQRQCFLLLGFVFESPGEACSVYVGWNSSGNLPAPGREAVIREGTLARVRSARHPRDFRHEELFVAMRSLGTQAPPPMNIDSRPGLAAAVAATMNELQSHGLPYLGLMLQHRHGLQIKDVLKTTPLEPG